MSSAADTNATPANAPSSIDSHERARAYWRANVRLVGFCLAIWFVVSYGCGILFAAELNQFHLFGFKLGFWFAQQGSIFTFLLLIVFYVWRINALDRRFDVHEEDADAPAGGAH